MHTLNIKDVRALPGDSAFLIDDGSTSILYDTGFAFTGSKVAENVRRELKGRELNYIFLTHSHYDHALGSVYVKKAFPNVKIIAGEYASKIFSKPSARAVMRDLDRRFAAASGIDEYEDLIDELAVDITVNDGDKVRCKDMTFDVISFPGHTKCSVGFYLGENKLLLGSETLGVYGGDKIVVPSYLVGYEMTLDSIAKAEKLDISSVLVPHYGIISGDTARNYIKNGRLSAVETAEMIMNVLNNGGTDEDAIEAFKNKFYKGYVQTIYPIDAMELNTSIMIKLIRKELMGSEN